MLVATGIDVIPNVHAITAIATDGPVTNPMTSRIRSSMTTIAPVAYRRRASSYRSCRKHIARANATQPQTRHSPTTKCNFRSFAA